jgi:hypothetical protein
MGISAMVDFGRMEVWAQKELALPPAVMIERRKGDA